MNSNSTAAVVVTFNRKALLCECLDALFHQSYALDAVFVIDNASSDGTELHLREQGYLDSPLIRYIRLHQNLGGAGGFHTGMDAASKAGYDWIWLMDDDTEPHVDSLVKMEPYKQYPKVVAIANTKVDRFGNHTTDGLRFFNKRKAINSAYEQVRFSSFVGLLVRSSVIERIGLPKKEFFIHNDDTEYCIRLRSAGDIALATDSVVRHKEMARAEKGKRILSHVFYQKTIEHYCFDYFGHRNFAWIKREYAAHKLTCYCHLAARFASFAIAVLLFDSDHRWLRIKILAKANLDGLRATFDNDFPIRLRKTLSDKRDALIGKDRG